MKDIFLFLDSLPAEALPFLIVKLTFVFSYLIGSISFSILCARMMGLPDPRSIGSGNAGATNVLRTGNKVAAALTLTGDLLKGVLPVALACHYSQDPLVIGAAMLGVFFGHLYPIFFGFKGGKGVATTVGILIGLHWPLGLSMAGLWLTTLAITRISSLAALLTAAVSPIATYFWLGKASAIPVTIIAFFQFWKHRSNIKRLLSRKEPHVV
jgi:glycerol-3-phosphate acyltransferase PlsY